MAGINIRGKAKELWIKSMKTVGNAAASIANNTKYKVDEMTLQNRRRELAGDLSSTLYALWMKGEKFPAELTKMLEELQELDDRLNDMRAEKYAQGNTPKADAEDGEEKEEQAEDEENSEEEDSTGDEIEVSAPSIRTEIDGYFDQAASVDKTAKKVNNSLDQLTDKVRAFSKDPFSGEAGKDGENGKAGETGNAGEEGQ